MSPVHRDLRLSDIHPHQFARGLAQAVVEHIEALSRQLLGQSRQPFSPRPEDTEIYRVVRALAEYARGGRALTQTVREYLEELVPLYVAPLSKETLQGPEHEAPDTALGLIIHAALGRERLEHGQPISAAQLLALTGLDDD